MFPKDGSMSGVAPVSRLSEEADTDGQGAVIPCQLPTRTVNTAFYLDLLC